MSNNALLNIIKQIATEAVDSKRPMQLYFGEVTQEKPLQITIEQKKVLDENFLVLCREVTEYEVDMTVNHQVEKMQVGGKDPSVSAHKHMYKGRKTFIVHKGLKVGENVALLQMQGGQTYLVIDRVVL